jgi:DNA-binding XRE family transcriptional regulator
VRGPRSGEGFCVSVVGVEKVLDVGCLSNVVILSRYVQADVAHALGVSQARVSQIEHGQIDSLDTLRAFAEVLGAEVSIVVSRGPLTLKVA